LLLVEVEAEGCLIVDVAPSRDIQVLGSCGIELLLNRVLGVVELLEEVWLQKVSNAD
jgi:hypothetical protein